MNIFENDHFLFQWAQQSVKNIVEDISNFNLAYTSHKDICSVFPGQTLLAIQAPDGTQLEVPRPELGRNPKYQLHLKSESGQIFVLLINKEQHSSEPVVVQVPPPPEIADALKREGVNDILSAAQTVHRGVKREVETDDTQDTVKRGRFESVPSDHHEQSSDLRPGNVTGAASNNDMVTVSEPITSDFNINNSATEIPGFEDILSTESMKISTFSSISYHLVFSVFGPLIRLSPPPTDKDYCYNLDTSEGVCDLFDVLS